MSATYAADGPNPFVDAEKAIRAAAKFMRAAMASGRPGGPQNQWWGGGGANFGPGRGFTVGGPPFQFLFGGPPFGKSRRARRGDVRAAALSLLAEEPLNGYQIIQRLAERSGGAWRPSSGAVYPALQQLTDEGLVRVQEQDSKRVFHLTDEGRAYVRDHADELNAPWEAVADQTPGGIRSLQHVALQTAAALAQVAQAGSEEQIEQAARLLARTRQGLYRILADDEEFISDAAPGETDTDEA